MKYNKSFKYINTDDSELYNVKHDVYDNYIIIMKNNVNIFHFLNDDKP